MIRDGVLPPALARPHLLSGPAGSTIFEIKPAAMFEMVRPDLTIFAGTFRCATRVFRRCGFLPVIRDPQLWSISLYFKAKCITQSTLSARAKSSFGIGGIARSRRCSTLMTPHELLRRYFSHKPIFSVRAAHCLHVG